VKDTGFFAKGTRYRIWAASEIESSVFELENTGDRRTGAHRQDSRSQYIEGRSHEPAFEEWKTKVETPTRREIKELQPARQRLAKAQNRTNSRNSPIRWFETDERAGLKAAESIGCCDEFERAPSTSFNVGEVTKEPSRLITMFRSCGAQRPQGRRYGRAFQKNARRSSNGCG